MVKKRYLKIIIKILNNYIASGVELTCNKYEPFRTTDRWFRIKFDYNRIYFKTKFGLQVINQILQNEELKQEFLENLYQIKLKNKLTLITFNITEEKHVSI